MKNEEFDQQILSIVIKDDGSFNSAKIKKTYIEKHFPELYEYLKQRYDDIIINDSLQIKEIIYRIFNKIEKQVICPICGKPIVFNGRDYNIFCSLNCKNSDAGKLIIRQKTKNTCLLKYGVESTFSAETTKLKRITTCFHKYGVGHPSKIKAISEKISNTQKNKSKEEQDKLAKQRKNTTFQRYGDENYRNIKQAKQTKLERYNNDKYNNIEQIKSTCFQKYGVTCVFASNQVKDKISETCQHKYGNDWYTQTKEFLDSSYISKKKNKTFGKSKIEQLIYDKLLFNSVDYQHKDDIYPYSCDYYIPAYKLYIELQGLWTHGKHPFNPDSEEDQKKLKLWKSKNTKYYDGAIKVWTVTDPLKRETAKKNNLNYLEIFSCDVNEAIRQINEYIKTYSEKS